MRKTICTALMVASACSTNTHSTAIGGPVSPVHSLQGVAVSATCECEVSIRETGILEEDESREDNLCPPTKVSACCIKNATQQIAAFNVTAWYQGNPGIDYEMFKLGDEARNRSGWVLQSGQVIVYRPAAKDGYCASYERGVLSLQIIFQFRQ